MVTRGTSQLGQEYAESLAAGISSVLYAGQVPHAVCTDAGRVTVAITTQSVGHGGKVNLNFFAPNIAVVFLFIGSGLGMRSILMERAAARCADHRGPAAADADRSRKVAGIFVTAWPPSS